MFKTLYRFDKWLDSHLILIFLLALLLVLRLPNFFEPYWYGDEGIYLTIGNGLRQGKVLYRDIIDHKTPIIYYLAMVPSQLDFRLLNLAWMSVTVIAFYHLCKELLAREWTIVLATLLFVVLTSLPWLEGNIPNGELFVMGFILIGFYFLSGTKLFNDFFKAKSSWLDIGLGNKEETLSVFWPKLFAHEQALFYLSGIFFGLGILTKVPALFDLVAAGSIWWLVLSKQILAGSRTWFGQLRELVLSGVSVLFGAATVILFSVFYFVLRGAGAEYLQFGLLYNFRYAGSWDLGLNNPVLSFLLSMSGKLLILALVLSFVTIFIKKLRPTVQFVSLWFALSLFGTLLSSRPYPHYFLQLVPSFCLLLALNFDAWLRVWQKNRWQLTANWKKFNFFETGLSLFLLFLTVQAFLILQVKPYPALAYYSNFERLVTGRLSTAEYYNRFESLMADNYAASKLIKDSGEQEIFIWGTNPTLYALTKTSPTGRFTVSFHIKDFKAYEESLASVVKKRPFFVVVMNNENTDLPGLYSFLEQHYIPNTTFEHFTLWKLL